jgi:iron complex transport system ATP-binding protein
MSAAPLLAAERLAVGYRRRRRRHPVLTALNLTVASGELVCVLGPNGIGKSTLLRTLAGLQRPLAGAVSVAGDILTRLTAFDRARLIGVVLPERIWVGALSARQMVALGRYAHCGWSGRLTPADFAIVDRAIEAVGAEHLAGRDCRELSDGERQKLNLARVLAQEPALIILDEPTAFLDVSARIELMSLMRRLTRERGTAVVASTHDLELAIRNADTAWLIGPDRRLHAGAPEDLVASGVVAEAFASRRIRFDSARGSFRESEADLPTAFVGGSTLGVRLAASAIEREGFELVDDRLAAGLVVDMVDDRGRWRAQNRGGDVTGTNFAALAAYARRAFAEHRPPAPSPRFNSTRQTGG